MKIINRLFAMVCVIAFSLACSSPPKTPVVTFSPAPGTYSAAQFVSLSVPNVEAMYVTTDGTVPTASCTAYNNNPIEISGSTTLNVLYVVDGKQYSTSAVYQINNSNGYLYANFNAMQAWLAWEKDTRCEMVDCTNPTAITSPFNCPNGGNIVWSIAVALPNANSTVTYNNCQYTSLDEETGITNTLTVSGTINAAVNVYTKNGTTAGQVNLTGDWDAAITDDLVLTNASKTDGSYTVSCANGGCSAKPVSYMAPDWEEIPGNDTLTCSP